MTNPIAILLSKLETQNQQLNQAADDASRAVAHVQDFLTRIGLGVSAMVNIQCEQNNCWYLTHQRIDGKFKLGLVEASCGNCSCPDCKCNVEGETCECDANCSCKCADGVCDPSCFCDEEAKVYPWPSGPRAIKVISVNYIPQLLERLLTKTQDICTQSQQTQDAIQQITGAFTAGSSCCNPSSCNC